MNFLKDFNYKNEGDYLYPVEYYHFHQASTHNTFKVELLCFDDRYHFNLTIDNESVPSKYRLVTSISFDIYEEFGIVPYDFSSKEATLQIAIDTASAIAKKYCEKPVTQ
ncbi:hypothetical protein [Bacillus mycoides]|uniref:hypothetical protein n=1 Tax=Bacillus mycoides TaxID=1405 RepID=UPI0002799065|nr:hypothetical protein [Bacillus mycoides]EJR92714.1 hypothetical protein IKM_06117 [Bacillus mycoides]